jgi:hypothetical protein
MTPTDVREIAEAAGREVVRETLLAIASTSPTGEAAARLRRHARGRRRGDGCRVPQGHRAYPQVAQGDRAGRDKDFIAAVGMIATGVVGLVWAAIKGKFVP